MAPAEMSIILSLSHTLWNEQNVTAELSASFMNFKYFSLHTHKKGTWRVVSDGLGASSHSGYYGILGVSEIMNAWLLQVHSWPTVHVQAEQTVPLCVQNLTIGHFVVASREVFRMQLSQHTSARFEFSIIISIQQNLYWYFVAS